MRRKWNRFVAGLLSIIMLVTMLPMEVLAAGNGGRAEQPSQTMPFQDVKSSDWCAKAVEYVYSHNLFSGTSATTFTPNGTMTRGMFVTVLGRMAGVNPDDHSGETPFSDVPQTMYYAPYVQWAARYGITVGTDDGKFSPDAFINRHRWQHSSCGILKRSKWTMRPAQISPLRLRIWSVLPPTHRMLC